MPYPIIRGYNIPLVIIDVQNTYLATYPPVGPAAPIPAGGGPLPPTPPSSPPFQIASSSLNSFDL